MQQIPPAAAHAELVLVAVTRIVVMGHGDGQAVAVHRGIGVGENQVAVDKADAASPCQSRRLMVVSQITFQTRKARDMIPILQHFLAHDGGICRRCIDIANAQFCGRDEVVRAQTKHGIAMRRKMALSMI